MVMILLDYLKNTAGVYRKKAIQKKLKGFGKYI